MNSVLFNRASMGALALLVAFPATAYASDAPEGAQLTEIVVTARRVEERLQDVPASVTAINAEKLRALGSMTQLQNLVPGLIFQSFGGSLPMISLRGQGNRLSGTPVNLYIGVFEDGVSLPSTLVASGPIDPARIEVAKGPQSTLYGRATMAGAINTVSQDPSDTPEGFAEVGAGASSVADERLWHAKLALAGPLSEDGSLKGRIVLLRQVRDGYIYDPANGLRGGGYDRYAARVKFLWEPVEDLSVRLSGVWLKDNAPRGTVMSPNINPPLAYNVNMADLTAAAKPLIDQARDFGKSDWDSHFSSAPYAKINANLVTLDVRYQTSIGEFASLSNFARSEVLSRSEVDDTALSISEVYGDNSEERFAQEFRLSGQMDRLSYLFGAYYLKSELDLFRRNFDVTSPSLTYGYGSANFDRPSITSINPAQSIVATYSPGYLDISAYAAFAQLGYNITDQLNITAGLRRGHDKFSGTASSYTRNGNGNINTLLAPFYREASFNATTGSAVVSYKFTPDIMAYASYGRGDSPGGLNGGATQAAASTPYKPQKVDAVEIGLKSLLMDRRLRLNVAAFSNKFKDLQITRGQNIQVPGGLPGQTLFQNVTANAAKSYGRGAEMDVTWALTSSLQAAVGYTYLRSKINDYEAPSVIPGNPTPLDYSGAPVLRSPKHSGNASVTYRGDLGPGAVSLTADLTFTSSYTNDYLGVPAGTAYQGRPGVPAGVTTQQVLWFIPVKGYTTFGLSGSYTMGAWEVSAYVRNLFNKEYLAAASSASPLQIANATPGEPRTFEVSLRRSF